VGGTVHTETVAYRVLEIRIKNYLTSLEMLSLSVVGITSCWFTAKWPLFSWCLLVCLFVCLCRVFLSRLWSDFDQTWTYVICLGL